MNKHGQLSILVVGALAVSLVGCVVTSGDDDDDFGCSDRDNDGICDANDCAPDDPTNDCDCPDADGDGVCNADDCAPNDPTVWACDCPDADGDNVCDADDCYPNDAAFWECCVDTDGDTVCDVDDCYPNDPAYWDCDCLDSDFDGVCDDVDCYPHDYKIWDCGCDDYDGDEVCDENDISDCIDDRTGEYTCGVDCTSADNVCFDPWNLAYCAEGAMWTSNCSDSCMTDERVYGPTCGSPALAGECDAFGGVCICWCEDSFDTCVDQWRVQYTREGSTYEVHCGQYCGGICDAELGACACP